MSLFQPALQVPKIGFSKEALWKIVCITRIKTQRMQLVWLQPSLRSGRKLHTRLQWLCFVPCNAIVYTFSVPVKRDESAVCNPTFKVSPLGLKIAVVSRFTGTENRIFKRGAMKYTISQCLLKFFQLIESF